MQQFINECKDSFKRTGSKGIIKISIIISVLLPIIFCIIHFYQFYNDKNYFFIDVNISRLGMDLIMMFIFLNATLEKLDIQYYEEVTSGTWEIRFYPTIRKYRTFLEVGFILSLSIILIYFITYF